MPNQIRQGELRWPITINVTTCKSKRIVSLYRTEVHSCMPRVHSVPYDLIRYELELHNVILAAEMVGFVGVLPKEATFKSHWDLP